ncbi:MAG TPA: TraR/DksA C4-type zinc finger protein [Ktedonobacterales bacterium]|nr:TraR/DksA C4-type zinc finger protein [Ktedonobacterales bacterium]
MLSPDVLAELKRALEAKRAALRAELRIPDPTTDTVDSALGNDADITGDEGDSSVDLEEVDREAGEWDDARSDLADVEHALSKFALGTYGVCELGGEPIPVERLRALPEARYDVQHQAEIEARQGR